MKLTSHINTRTNAGLTDTSSVEAVHQGQRVAGCTDVHRFSLCLQIAGSQGRTREGGVATTVTAIAAAHMCLYTYEELSYQCM